MTIKSFFANSVAAAMQQAREELGEDAMLLRSRRTPSEWSDLGAYEVVFGASAGDDAEFPRFSSEDDSGRIDSTLRHTQSSTDAGPVTLEELFGALVDFEVEESVAEDLLELAEQRLRARHPSRRTLASPADLICLVEPVCRELFPADSSLGEPNKGWSVALLGPPGCGKTAAIVRLAVSHGIGRGRQVKLLAFEDGRVGGNEKLQRYAELLDLEFEIAATIDDLDRSLNAVDGNGLLLIDTPGLGPRDLNDRRELAGFLASRTELQRHLVLPASMGREDLRRTAAGFSAFRADRLLFTKLDETERWGPMFSETALSSRPLSFCTTGQQVPGDIVSATALSLPRLLDSRTNLSLVAVA